MPASSRVASLLCVLVVAATASAQIVTFTPANLDRAVSPRNVAAGGDLVAFSSERYTPHPISFFDVDDGRVTSFEIPCDGCASGTNMTYVEDLAFGADGNAWFLYTVVASDGSPLSGGNNNFIGRMTPAGAFTRFAVPTMNAFRRYFNRTGYAQIARGPDGMWFTENEGQKVGRVSYDGTITEFPLAPFSNPSGIVAGPDGNLWFTETASSKVGRITTAGALTELALPANSFPIGIAASGASLYVTARGRKTLQRVTTSGTVTEMPMPPGGNGLFIESVLAGDTSGATLFITDPDLGAIDWLDADGLHTAKAPANEHPFDLALVEKNLELQGWASATDDNFVDVALHFEVAPAPGCEAPPTPHLENERSSLGGIANATIAVVNAALYEQRVDASGGTPPYTFRVVDGALPPGVALAPNGDITGTPTTAGTYEYTVEATDSKGCKRNALGPFVMEVVSDCSYVTIGWFGRNFVPKLGTSAKGAANVSLNVQPPLEAVRIDGLPPGMGWEAAGQTILISGVPEVEASRTFDIEIEVTDSNGCTRTETLKMEVQKSKAKASRPK